MTRPRVVVADDAPLIRQGVRELLVRGGCDVVGEAGSISEVDGLLLTGEPFDVLVLDIRMPPTHTDEGVVLLERLRAAGSTLGVLLLSMYASPSLALRAMSAGHGTGYLLKEWVADGDALVAAVRAVVSGGSVVDPAVVSLVVGTAGPAQGADQLTDREREVLQLMAQGLSNLGIADRMHLSVKTVETHIAHLLDKLSIEPNPSEHRRVLAVLELLRTTQ
jgi:DNA-binding NarL/FixJ family response regulator